MIATVQLQNLGLMMALYGRQLIAQQQGRLGGQIHHPIVFEQFVRQARLLLDEEQKVCSK
jgi:hypothetical protein